MGKNQLMPLIGKKIPEGLFKVFIVVGKGHKNNDVYNIMEVATGKILTKTRYTNGTIVDSLTRNPKRVSKAVGEISKLIKK